MNNGSNDSTVNSNESGEHLRGHQGKTVACLGAGPKSLAIAALANAINSVFGTKLRVIIFERESIGANWLGGDAGYTDGEFPLDTSPFKDLGFPYRSGYGHDVDHLLGHLSYIEYLKATDQFLDFICRGEFKISHRAFSHYLRWAAASIGADVRQATIGAIVPTGSRGHVELRSVCGKSLVTADGLVLTGPGESKRFVVQDEDPERVFDACTYWSRRALFRDLPAGRVAVIGGGQSAGTIAKSLVTLNPKLQVDVMTRQGFLCAQSAGFNEGRLCSIPPANWTSLPIEQRREILYKVNNGVVEASTKSFLDAHPRVSAVSGVVRQVRVIDGKVRLAVGASKPLEYDAAVIAIGFDPVASLRKLLPGQIEHAALLRNPDMANIMDHHLRVKPLESNIHVPAMSALSQGPGLSLLSCLGTVASRIVSAYLAPEDLVANDVTVFDLEVAMAQV